jgi:hypothetical protein
MLSTLEPNCSKVEVIIVCAPLPIDIRAITAPTPIIIPSMVSEERSLLADRDFIAITNESTNFTG